MEIREAREEDAAAIVALIDQVALQDETLGLDRYPGGATQLRQQIAETPPEASAFLVAADEGAVIGYAFVGRYVTPSLSHVGVLSIVVDPGHRRTGTGRRLMQRGEAWARAAGVRKLTLSVLATNRAGRALFSACGFEDEAVRKGQLRVGSAFLDEVLMVRWLT